VEDQDAAADRDQIRRDRGERDHRQPGPDLEAASRRVEATTEAANAASVQGLTRADVSTASAAWVRNLSEISDTPNKQPAAAPSTNPSLDHAFEIALAFCGRAAGVVGGVVVVELPLSLLRDHLKAAQV
jgi:hypothetical protein